LGSLQAILEQYYALRPYRIEQFPAETYPARSA
jgi:hypothetical protein